MYRLHWCQCCCRNLDTMNQTPVVNKPTSVTTSLAARKTQYFRKFHDFKETNLTPNHPCPCPSLCLSPSELVDGTPTLKINHGSGKVVLQLPGNVNVADRRWHRLDVRSNSKVGHFTHFTPTTIQYASSIFTLSFTVLTFFFTSADF